MHEVHATTALSKPNWLLPARVGLVYYLQSNYIFPQDAKFIPLNNLRARHRCMKSLQAFGFKFPDRVKLKKLKKEKTNAS